MCFCLGYGPFESQLTMMMLWAKLWEKLEALSVGYSKVSQVFF